MGATAKNITLREGKSHTVILGGAEIKFENGRPKLGVTDPVLVRYCENQPVGRFLIVDAEKVGKPDKKNAAAGSEQSEEEAAPAKSPRGGKKGKKGGRKKKVKVDDE